MEAGGVPAAALVNRAPASPADADSHRPLQGVWLNQSHAAEERSHTAQSAGWEDAIALLARNTAVGSEPPAESLRSCNSTASMKVKNVKKLSLTKRHFPRLAECAHFHYDNVDVGSVQLSLAKDQSEVTRGDGLDTKELTYLVQICCQGQTWIVKRSYEDFRVLDKHLHLCIYDRRFSQLLELPRFDSLKDEPPSQMLTAYLSRLSAIADNKINCGPALTWMEIDNKGNHLLVHDESSINVPAVAAAHVIKRYTAQAADELSFEVGDIVSVIDMPPKEDTGWWRGKHGFQVGFFPAECVELISEKVPPNMTGSLPKPVCKKHGKLITFLRSFVKSRPTKQKLRQCGILRERVFGCDLGEHLLNSGRDVPQVIKSCTEFIEKCGVVDGIYRLSGVASNIQKLRHEFDSEHVPDLSKDVTIQDIHSVGSLCKLYFRELPNPLLTYQLYDRFSDAVSAATNDERLVKIHDVIQQLPPPHYRTLEFLMRHLARMATFSSITNMHCKNLAIVWAPNLLRSKQIESASFSGTSAFMEVRVQSVVVEFILSHVDVLFSPRLSTLIRESAGHNTVMRPKSLLVCSPSTKLLSLEEAQARTQAQLTSPVSPISPVSPDAKYIEVGEGPTALQGKFHTVIELPAERKKAQSKVKKSPVAGWRSFFNMGKSSTAAKRKLLRHPSEPNQIKTMVLPGGRGDSGTMRSAKSEESLSSHTHEGGSGVYRSRRPRSTSDAMSTSFSEELLNSRGHGGSQSGRRDGGAGGKSSAARAPPRISPPLPADARLTLEPSSLRLGPPAEGAGAPVEGKGGSRGEAAERNRVGSLALPPDVLPKALEDRNHGHEADVAVETEGTSQPVKPGAVMFDCTPGLVRSVSLFTPQPAGKSAARILALALAESAEQASRLRKRGSSEPPTPISPLHLQDPLSLMQWPPPSPPQPQTPPVPKKDPCFSCGAFVDSSSAISAGNCTDSSSPRSTCACRDSQSGLSCSDGGGDGAPAAAPEENALPHHLASARGPDAERSPESPASVRENVRHVGVGTDAGGPDLASETDPHESLKPRLSPPENPPACHVPEGHSATAALLSKRAANASNFRAILAEAAMPSSVQEVLPHAPVSSPSSRYQYGPTDGGLMGSLGPVYPQHWSSPLKQSDPYLQPGRQQHHTEVFSSHYSTLTPRSLHLSIKYKGQQRYNDSPGRFYGHSGPRYPPMDGASVYPTIRRVRSMHAPPEDKFFFSQRPSCQNNPYQRPVSSDIHRVQPFFEDGRVQYRYSPFPEARHPDAYRANSQGYSHSYSTHRLPVHSGRVLRSVQNVHDPRLNPPSRERSFIKEDVRPLSRGKDAAVYEALDAGLCDRRFGQSVRQGNVWNKRLPDLAVSHAHLQRGTQRCQVPVHARGKFDSGKDMLISTEGADGKYRVTMVGQYSPEHPLSEPDACQYERPERRGSGHSAKASLLLKQSCSMLNYPQPPAHHPGLQKEYSCPDFKHSDSADGGGGGARLGGQDRPMFQTLSGCLMDDYQHARFRGQGLERSERSQSVRGHQQEAYTKRTLERDHSLAYSARRRPRTCSMFVPSRSDYTDAHASAKRKGAQPARLGTAVFPQYGCLNPQSSRLHSWALGPGAFPHSELRAETEIYAE